MLNARFPIRRLLASTAFACAAVPASATDYYVDFDSGHDTAAGVSAAAPWQHAPGDANATGAPAMARLAAGDRVLFHGGVAYRGHILVNRVNGAADNPVRYVGDAWGTGKAIMHGGEPLGAGTPCPSQAACLGAPAWRSVRVYPAGGAEWTDFVIDDGPLTQVAQYPLPADAMSYDAIAGFTAIPAMYEPLEAQGSIRFVGAVPGPGAQLALWTLPNTIAFSSGVTPVANLLTFTPPANFSPYAGRTNYYAVVNDAQRLVAPGQFTLTGGRVYYASSGTTPPWIGARRQGFEIGNSTNISIEGFRFTGFSSDDTTRSGIPIGIFSGHNDGISIERNDFTKMALRNGQAAVQLMFVNGVTIRGNSFDSLVWASGIRVVSAAGPVTIACNTFAATGRTAIYLQDVLTSEVAYNRLNAINGLHGNGISLYRDVRQSSVHDNIITDSIRPVTLLSATPYFDPSIPARISIANNVIDVTQPKAIAIESWGGGVHNVSITGTTLIGPGKLAVWGWNDNNNSVGAATVAAPTLPGASGLLTARTAAAANTCAAAR